MRYFSHYQSSVRVEQRLDDNIRVWMVEENAIFLHIDWFQEPDRTQKSCDAGPRSRWSALFGHSFSNSPGAGVMTWVNNEIIRKVLGGFSSSMTAEARWKIESSEFQFKWRIAIGKQCHAYYIRPNPRLIRICLRHTVVGRINSLFPWWNATRSSTSNETRLSLLI